MVREVWIWQSIVTPHIAGLAAALASHGCKVTYVAEQTMSSDRAMLGWTMPDLGSASIKLMGSLEQARILVDESGRNAIHICQGVRANGLVQSVQNLLRNMRRKHWVIMETPEDSDWLFPLRRLVYRWKFYRMDDALEGVLAIGALTPEWLRARGVAKEKIFPFAYFLEAKKSADITRCSVPVSEAYQVAFVGRFIPKKRFDLLVRALCRVDCQGLELLVIGSGPMEAECRSLAVASLPGKVKWIGGLSIAEVSDVLASIDCLVLPSSHDGWGAVVSEALIVGTPAICSNRCGSQEAVIASGVGGVFSAEDELDLARLLEVQVSKGKVSADERLEISSWARGLSADWGAKYLLEIVHYSSHGGVRPSPPWRR